MQQNKKMFQLYKTLQQINPIQYKVSIKTIIFKSRLTSLYQYIFDPTDNLLLCGHLQS